MKEIRDAGLNKLYCGMESGSALVLKNVKKGITPESIIQSARMAKKAGMDTTQFIILGLGGRELSKVHAIETANVLNQIDPNDIRVLTIGVKPESGLGRQMAKGDFTLPWEKEIIEEQRILLENLKGITSHYANHHSVDLLLEVRGQLPRDKSRLLAILDCFLSLDQTRQINFILGRRLGDYRQLSDMADENLYQFVENQADKIQNEGTESFEELFHRLRKQVI
jgi:hypothetical protein